MIRSLQKARSAEPTHGRRGVEEHRALVDAVANRDAQGATQLMSVHLNRTAARVSGT
jgi:GntR family transcriptional regulator, transcriptional repressor for pyruvate dehydrogenase complex